MDIDSIYILGAGGHAKVVVDALQQIMKEPTTISVYDGDPNKSGQYLLGVDIHYPLLTESLIGTLFHVALGDCRLRRDVFSKAESLGGIASTIYHPRSCVSKYADVDEGAFIAALSVLGVDTKIGRGVIVNHGAMIDHDCNVGAFSHIAPNSTLCGNVTIGSGVLVGAGATILPGITIGDGCVVGAGCVVTSDLPPGQVFVGNRKR